MTCRKLLPCVIAWPAKQRKLVEVGSPHEIIQKYNTDKKVRLEYEDLTTKTVPFDELQGGLIVQCYQYSFL